MRDMSAGTARRKGQPSPIHYVKVLGHLREWAVRVAGGSHEWQADLFADLTDGGRQIAWLPLADNREGGRIGLSGNRYFCEAGVDQEREDTLYVFRVVAADRRPLRQVPARYDA